MAKFCLSLFTICLAVSLAAGFWGSDPFPKWNKLSVTWGSFSDMPMNVKDAMADSWKRIPGGCEASIAFRGNRYMQGNDSTLILLFDSNGQIAGIQFAVPTSTKIPINRVPPFVEESGLYYMTAYFIEPKTICSAPTRDEDYVGDLLLLQNGPTFDTTMRIPLREKDIGTTKWVKGKCFWSMGQHYWYNVSNQMNCDDFFPMFLLYNGDVLNGFGWATGGDVTSPRVEHPTPDKFHFFFDPATEPACLAKMGPLTTQHVFLERLPYLNHC